MSEAHTDPHPDLYTKTIFGFWVYLITDFMMFAAIFAAYAVLRHSNFGGKTPAELFDLSCALSRTVVLWVTCLSAGIAGAMAHRRSRGGSIFFFVLTFLLAVLFLAMQFGEYCKLIHMGQRWDTNAYLSAFWTVLGTHTVHMFIGLLWTIVVLIPLIFRGLTDNLIRKLTCLRMFWQFLGIVWIFIFTIVYLLGVH